MNTIKVYGSGCPSCHKLKQMCYDALAENNLDASVIEVSDIKEIAGAGILSTPALEINGKILTAGKLPVKATLVRWILDNLTITNEHA